MNKNSPQENFTAIDISPLCNRFL